MPNQTRRRQWSNRNTLQDLLDHFRPRYGRAVRREKQRIVEEFVATTEYRRKYAIQLLRHGLPERRQWQRREGIYPATLDSALAHLGEIPGSPTAPYSHDFLPHFLAAMEEHQEICLTSQQRTLLLQMSTATIDQRLQPVPAAATAASPTSADQAGVALAAAGRGTNLGRSSPR